MYDFEAAMGSLDPWPGLGKADRVVREICVTHNDLQGARLFQRRLLWFPDSAVIAAAARELASSGDVERFALIFDVLADEVALPNLGTIPGFICDQLAVLMQDQVHSARILSMLREIVRDYPRSVAAEAEGVLAQLGLAVEGFEPDDG